LETLGLIGFENRITHNLSYGEKSLVSLATVWAMQPEVLLLDEPIVWLDEKTIGKVEHKKGDSLLFLSFLSLS